jgi:hypothetical protein
MTINDLPDEILLNILSYIEPQDLYLIIAKVCEKWNALAKDVSLWKDLCYTFEGETDINNIEEVRWTTLLLFSTN